MQEQVATSNQIHAAKAALEPAMVDDIQRYRQQMDERMAVAMASVRANMASPEALSVGASSFPQRQTLYLFWSWEAPGAINIPSALRALAVARPDIPVAETHCMRTARWERYMYDAYQFNRATKSLMAEGREAEAIALGHAMQAKTAPLLQMQEYFGVTGFRPFTDMRPAIALGVDRLPCWRYVSANGLIHGIAGAGPNLDLADWIGRIDRWEVAATATAAKNLEDLITWADKQAVE
jgi:hypothetical protein